MKERSKFDSITVSVPTEECESNFSIPDLDIMPMDKQEAIRFGQDTKHRKWLVLWMMIIVSFWLVIVLIITMFNKLWHFDIGREVMITLLATTTINVLGLANIILNGLFENHSSIKKLFTKRQRNSHH